MAVNDCVLPSVFDKIDGLVGVICSDTSVAESESAGPAVVVTELGLDPAGNGEPLTGVNAPVAALIV